MKRHSTRDRILVTCRKLFNTKGVSAVTTAAIAEAVGINEGNLYYYFKKKGEIVTALFERFATDQLDIAAKNQNLRDWFQLMWEWRFFYRDTMSIFALEPPLRARLQLLADQVQARSKLKLVEMIEIGQLKATEAELDMLLENCWIISTYWIEYLHSRHGISRITKKHLDWGYQQMAALFQPYLHRPLSDQAESNFLPAPSFQ
ncbi:TetR/AcrR family transcriptional regulator [Pseudomonas yamanorum]|uniref:TetR/AcrR family transcriptional regulator n=1 Tax=Pseudomonas yamanorum TaxID=515393 RepID=UPI0015A1551A|nr:TetR/AcrR family transcriptional regulator [Pseudomonas yamanorum]NWD25726.1 TetR/AcrR family transcriptional regulator [Pseudomonas yamanorum]